jgi:glycosyltransferase involved in cell wall biosynthesis
MLRIAVVTSYFPSSAEPWQGRSAYQTLRVLARQAEVQVFYPNAAYPKFLKPRNRSYRKLEISFKAQDVNAGYYDFPALPLVSRPFNGWMAARSVLPYVRAFAPDLIFSYFLYPDGYAALKVGQALGVPVAAMSIGSDINRMGDRISAHHTRTVLREADFLLTVSEDLRRKALAMGASMGKSRAVTNGCDATVFHLRDKGKARRSLDIQPGMEAVVYVGRMDVKKGLRELVEAAVRLRERRGKLQVYLVATDRTGL